MEGEERRWFVEDHALRYAPSLKGLARLTAPEKRPAATLLVVNPEGDLPYSALEAEWVRETIGEAQMMTGEEATEAKVMSAFAHCTHLHFATHAEFNLEDPFESRIRLARGESLTLREVVQLVGQHRPDFIVLSACETAVARMVSLADEFLGFPSVLLAHGTRIVLATLWSVDDEATAILIGEFYRQYRLEKRNAAEALRRAQDWIRQLNNAELSKLVRTMRDRPGPAGSLPSQINTRLRGSDPDARPFDHPYYWAGFTISGGSSP